MKKILMTLFTLIVFIGSANTDSLTDTDKAAQKALVEQYVQALQNKDFNVVIAKDIFSALSDKEMLNVKLLNISLAEKDYPRVLKEIKQCVKAEPTFKACYDSWISVADKTKNYDEETAAYNAVSKNLGYQYIKSMFNE